MGFEWTIWVGQKHDAMRIALRRGRLPEVLPLPWQWDAVLSFACFPQLATQAAKKCGDQLRNLIVECKVLGSPKPGTSPRMGQIDDLASVAADFIADPWALPEEHCAGHRQVAVLWSWARAPKLEKCLPDSWNHEITYARLDHLRRDGKLWKAPLNMQLFAEERQRAPVESKAMALEDEAGLMIEVGCPQFVCFVKRFKPYDQPYFEFLPFLSSATSRFSCTDRLCAAIASDQNLACAYQQEFQNYIAVANCFAPPLLLNEVRMLELCSLAMTGTLNERRHAAVELRDLSEAVQLTASDVAAHPYAQSFLQTFGGYLKRRPLTQPRVVDMLEVLSEWHQPGFKALVKQEFGHWPFFHGDPPYKSSCALEQFAYKFAIASGVGMDAPQAHLVTQLEILTEFAKAHSEHTSRKIPVRIETFARPTHLEPLLPGDLSSGLSWKPPPVNNYFFCYLCSICSFHFHFPFSISYFSTSHFHSSISISHSMFIFFVFSYFVINFYIPFSFPFQFSIFHFHLQFSISHTFIFNFQINFQCFICHFPFSFSIFHFPFSIFHF